MRTNNIKVKLTIPISYDKPDLNGVCYTKEAIENAIKNYDSKLPILYQANERDSIHLIGVTDNTIYFIEWDDENQVCRFTIDGVIFYGGADIMVNKIQDGKITDFEFRGFGLSE